jgi:hypothetical protein
MAANEKNPQWANVEKTAINLIVTHEIYGEIPFTASPNDPEEYGRVLYTQAAAGEFGPVAEFSPPVVPAEVSPVEKLKNFLEANPDVAAALEAK